MRDTLFGRRGTLFSCAALCVSVMACDGVSLEVLAPTDASTIDASDATTLDADAAIEGSSCVLLAVGASCAYSEECCSGLCALDTTSRQTCRPTTGCVGLGGSCNFAGACCSLGCFAPDGTSGACTDTSLCAPLTTSCNQPQDCCSNVCNNGTCAKPPGPACLPAGETCKGNPDCCGGVCTSASDQTLRCALLQGCRVAGEICSSANDCCSGVCNVDGRCMPPMACNAGDGKGCKSVAWDTCAKNDECCSAVPSASRRRFPLRANRRMRAALRAMRRRTRTVARDRAWRKARSETLQSDRWLRGGRRGVHHESAMLRRTRSDMRDRSDEPRSASMRNGERRARSASGSACAVGRDCCGGECVPVPPIAMREQVLGRRTTLHRKDRLLQHDIGLLRARRHARLRASHSLTEDS